MNSMLDEGGTGGGWAKACDSCRSAPSAVYCRADAAYLCAACDGAVHAANRLAWHHERVWVCEGCERAPAALACRADAAALCAACDAEVHAANPLARRHHRAPVIPLPPGRLTASRREAPPPAEDHDEAPAAQQWALLNRTTGLPFGGEVDEYQLDPADYTSCNENRNQEPPQQHAKNEGSECVVPSPSSLANEQQQSYDGMGLEYEVSDAAFAYAAPLRHSVSLPSMEVSIEPDTTMADISESYVRNPKGTIDLFSGPSLQVPPQFTPMDREARVLRYREKKKTRKFEKTIRYASRKAYAETRPRIKGRFAKRSDIEVEVDQMFSTSVLSEGSYGIVPSF